MALIFVIGTRAQLVKMAPVIKEASNAGLAFEILLTGQHFDSMSDLADDLGIGSVFPREHLLAEQSSVAALAGWLPTAFWSCLGRLRAIRRRSPGALVVVHGDTASTLVGAVAGRMAGLRVAHVESGLSSGAAFDPFPEELVRKLVTRIANIAFCPDVESYNRLRGRRRLVVHDTRGNTIADALRVVLRDSPPQRRGGVLVSLHRFENIMHRNRLQQLVADILRLAGQRPVSFVLHPPTEKRLRALGLLESLRACDAIALLPRMPYSRFIKVAATVDVVVTDGGSNQEELSLLGVPAIILRSRTERSDGLGRSGLLEPDIAGSWVDFILTGGADALRHPPLLALAASPSKHIVDVLAVESRAQ